MKIEIDGSRVKEIMNAGGDLISRSALMEEMAGGQPGYGNGCPRMDHGGAADRGGSFRTRPDREICQV